MFDGAQHVQQKLLVVFHVRGVDFQQIVVAARDVVALGHFGYVADDGREARVSHPALASHPGHELYRQYLPHGGGSIFTFEVKGGQEEAWRFIDALRIFSLLANVADVKSLVIHPYTTTHSQLSAEELAQQHITPATVRLSVGMEHIDDLLADLEQALQKI